MAETFQGYLDTGSGRAEFRVEIEGCPIVFCTADDMRGTVSTPADMAGVRRVSGLRREGLSFQESANLPSADYKASVGSVSIVDEDTSVAWNKRAGAYAFSKVARTVGYLAEGCTASATSIVVKSTAGFTANQVYHLDTEAVLVTAIDAGTGTLTVTRGMWRTTAQAHFVAASTLIGDRTLTCPVYDAVPTYRRRRVWVYGHGYDELGLADAGVLIARGVLAAAPQLSEGSTWSFSIAPVTTLLDAEIGPREGATQITGIYYPGASPYRITINRNQGAERVGPWDSRISVYMVGRWLTNADFCEELTTELNDAAGTAGWTEVFSARAVDAGWELFVLTAAVPDQRYLWAEGGSAIDGVFTLDMLRTTSEIRELEVSASTEYRFLWGPSTDPAMGYSTPPAGLRGVPRSANFSYRSPGTPADIAAYPWHAFYLAAAAGVQVGDTLRCDIPEGEEQPARSWEATVTEVNADEGLVIWDPDTMRVTHVDGGVGLGPLGVWTIATPAAMPTLSIPRNYGLGQSLAYLLADVWSDAPDNANAGSVPFILPGDFADLSVLVAAVEEAAAGAGWLLHRRWSFAKPVRFSDVVKHELRLLGAFMATDSTGAITIRPLTPRLEDDATITSADLVNDESFGDLITEPEGILTGYTIRTGYNAAEDDHKGRDLEITMLGALAIQRTRTALEIAPKSTAAGAEPSEYEIVAHLGAAVAIWSRQRFQVRIDVLATFYGTRLGDAVYVTVPQLPYDAERSIDGGGGGMIALRGTVVGRSWEFAEPAVSLTILFDSLAIVGAGYSPTGRVLSQTGATTSWTVTLAEDEYGPGGLLTDSEFFVTGMRVRLIEWDTTSPTIVTGTVTGVVGNDVSLTLDASWTPGASTWNLCFSRSTTSGLTEEQLEYAWIARDDNRVHLASGTRAPSVFWP